MSDAENMPKKKQINVSIPEQTNIKLEEYFKENDQVLTLMGIRSKAQLVAALLENGILAFDRMLKAAKSAMEP